MKLTRRQLKVLIENYLFEQEEGPPVEDEAESAEPPVEDEADAVEAETETPDETPAESGVDFPESTKPFEIVFDDIKHKIQFKKDESENIVKLFIDDELVSNPKPQDFVTLAGLGLQGVKDEDLKDHLTSLVKLDKSFEKFDLPSDVANQIKRKIDGSRPGYTDSDIRKIGLGKGKR